MSSVEAQIRIMLPRVLQLQSSLLRVTDAAPWQSGPSHASCTMSIFMKYLNAEIYGKWLVQASKQANIHTHVRNAITLVCGSLRLAPIREMWFNGCSYMRCLFGACDWVWVLVDKSTNVCNHDYISQQACPPLITTGAPCVLENAHAKWVHKMFNIYSLIN